MEGIKIKEVTKTEEEESFVKEASEKLDTDPESDEAVLELPSWMEYLGNDKYKVTTRKRTYLMVDIEYEKIMRAKARATGGKDTPYAMDNFEVALLAETIEKPKMTEMEVRKLKGSEYMRLRAALYKLYDMASFL